VPTHFRPFGALTAVVAGSLVITLGLAGPASADDYPSWDDVLNARQSEAATNAEIAKIESLLVTLESDADALGRVAQQRGEEYNAAKNALDAASAKSAKLQQQVSAAEERAAESSRRAGQLIAQFARTGGGSLSLGLMLSSDSDDLLNNLGTMSKITEQSALIYRQAVLDKNLAQALTDQAKLAEKKRRTLAATAQQALDAAKASADAALAKVAEQQAAAEQMYAQLATLKGTTADVEAGYAEGLTAAAEQAAQPPPPPTPANPPNPPPPAPNGSAVDGALAFAYAQLGDMYQFAGSGPDVWDCSGLTKAAYASVGVYIGAHVVSSQYYTMANQGRLVPLAQMAPGDLIFYADGGYPGDFYHVAMYVGGGQMIEAPREGIPVRITAVRYYDVLPYAGRPTP
jgi:cell wall-associated NlpC family hydrolase